MAACAVERRNDKPAADADGPLPGVGYAHTRADVVADPLNALAVLLTGEDVEPDLGPAIEALD
jgi:hypothetical protein